MERSSWMPSIVLTTSSIGWETWDSISAGEAPGRRVLTRTVGRSTDGKRSTSRFRVARRPDHHQRQHDHRREDRPADADFGELLHESLPHRGDGLASDQVSRLHHDGLTGSQPVYNFHALAGTPPGADALLLRDVVFDGDHLVDARERHD